ncbi:MAG: hypothetical protein HY602_01675 [Parcubacteria group bacterium]|nr:hypothetical protein [Parcubacteria group bacterium]
MPHEYLKFGSYTWHNLDSPDNRQLAQIANRFSFSHEHIKEGTPPIQRPKFIKNDHYIFIVAVFPLAKKESPFIEKTEIDLFITYDALITIHQSNPVIDEIFNQLRKDKATRELYKDQPALLLREIFKRSLNLCWPILDNISKNIDNLTRHVFNLEDKQILSHILELKTQIGDIKKIMRHQTKILQRLLEQGQPIMEEAILIQQFQSTIDMSADIMDNLEGFGESIDNLHQTYESATSFKLNNIIAFLTLISALMIPVFAITGIFNMKSVPESLTQPIHFWGSLAVMGAVVIILFSIFKKKRWL